ncbi:methylmalonyl-CoA mutase family protein [Jatrophihabitans sp.]|uniref:methylmalonyl-CoA mutase family protein n=1 Tax=Jatrophihabitans sp. TaxID=1932789 RepID=UPI002B9116C9|nr:methylmalonyl-CoA mutase subunit beta [Jatrophihabitans sp.]
MTAPEAHLELAAEFPAASREQWRSMVAAVLAKSGVEPATGHPEDALSYRTYDGLRIAPLYTAADLPDGVGIEAAGLPGRPPFVRGASAERAGWDVRQRVVEPDPAAARRAVLAELSGGASSIWLRVGSGGVPVESLAAVLDGVRLDLALDAGTDTEAAAEALLGLVRSRDLAPAEVAGTLGADPIGLAAQQGSAPDLAVLTRLAGAAADFPRLLPGTVDASRYAEAGGSDSDELAISVAVGVAYLRALTEAGSGIEQALAQLEFRYAVSADQWASMAKLRAARRLWDRVAELCGAPEQSRGQRQHAVTAAATLTRRDPWVNLLRATVGCFAAAVAGADAITVAPFDSALGLPDDFGRRIARNTQAILHDESSLARVLDPGGGSWYLESITEQLAEVAWDKFTAIERTGGAVAALESGMLAGMLQDSWQPRRDNLARRRDPITGVSEFAMPEETVLARRPYPAEQPGPAGLPRRRYAEEFEALRDRADARLAATGARPRVFLAALGPARAHAGRLGFARNLLAAGGIEAVVGTGQPDELVAAFRTHNTGTIGMALLCAADQDHADHAQTLAAALKAAGAVSVWIAGPPALVDGAVDAAVYTGCDAVAALTAMFELLEVAA